MYRRRVFSSALERRAVGAVVPSTFVSFLDRGLRPLVRILPLRCGLRYGILFARAVLSWRRARHHHVTTCCTRTPHPSLAPSTCVLLLIESISETIRFLPWTLNLSMFNEAHMMWIMKASDSRISFHDRLYCCRCGSTHTDPRLAAVFCYQNFFNTAPAIQLLLLTFYDDVT